MEIHKKKERKIKKSINLILTGNFFFSIFPPTLRNLNVIDLQIKMKTKKLNEAQPSAKRQLFPLENILGLTFLNDTKLKKKIIFPSKNLDL